MRVLLDSAGPTAVRTKCRRLTRLVYSHRPSEHTTPLLQELHWLRVPERFQLRLFVLADDHCVHGTAPAYLADSLRLTSEVATRCRLRSVDSPTLLVPSSVDQLSVIARFLWLQHGRGTLCHKRPGLSPRY